MRSRLTVLYIAFFLGFSIVARAEVSPTSPATEAAPTERRNKIVADLGANISKLGPSLGVFAGFQHSLLRVGALLDLGLTWYDWTEFYGLGLGPVFELPFQFRTSLIAGVGIQRFHFEACNEACKAARVDESRIAYEGRLGLGRRFLGGHRRLAIVVMGWFTANYSRKRQVASPVLDSDESASSGGFRPGGLLTAGIDFSL